MPTARRYNKRGLRLRRPGPQERPGTDKTGHSYIPGLESTFGNCLPNHSYKKMEGLHQLFILNISKTKSFSLTDRLENDRSEVSTFYSRNINNIPTLTAYHATKPPAMQLGRWAVIKTRYFAKVFTERLTIGKIHLNEFGDNSA